jgi:hypothetical protein
MKKQWINTLDEVVANGRLAAGRGKASWRGEIAGKAP